ncbi:hypothetical protein B0H17DRAFT_1145687 [Mycena rosella]|uniref:Uncharacterized protein n=1 Tax=Mycena rosella TaxID=1033263 RepID=A0AAD7CR24_MYCRO|nr:hypothetical protein B0H17DRAFT_1145687 [Mycena rosella]
MVACLRIRAELYTVKCLHSDEPFNPIGQNAGGFAPGVLLIAQELFRLSGLAYQWEQWQDNIQVLRGRKNYTTSLLPKNGDTGPSSRNMDNLGAQKKFTAEEFL